MDACSKRPVAPRLEGCSGLPSTLVARPSNAVINRPVERPAGHDLLGLARVGQDLLGRLLQASRRARERHRRAEQLHELAPRGAADLGGAGRELARRLEAALALLEAPPLRPRRRRLLTGGPDDGKLQRWHVVQLVRVATW